MKLEKIQNPALKKLIGDLKHASSTIENDFNDALEKSSTEKELIENWQSALRDLQNECEDYWGTLEKIKNKGKDLHQLITEGKVPPPGVLMPEECNATAPGKGKGAVPHLCRLPKGHSGKHKCCLCGDEWLESRLNIAALKTVKFSEPDPRSLRY